MRRRSSGAGVGFALLGGVVLVVLAIVLALRGPAQPAPAASAASAGERFPNAWPDPPPADVAALLGGLGPGASLTESWRVRGVSPVHEQRILVDVASGERGFRVALLLKERDPRRPPKATARYALFTLQPRPTAESLKDADYSAVLGALATLVEKNEGVVPVPAGM